MRQNHAQYTTDTSTWKPFVSGVFQFGVMEMVCSAWLHFGGSANLQKDIPSFALPNHSGGIFQKKNFLPQGHVKYVHARDRVRQSSTSAHS